MEKLNEKKIPDLIPIETACCGCGICSVICPSKAIKMNENEEGFLYPIINFQLCIGCLLCIENCRFKIRKEEVRNHILGELI